MCQKHGKCNIYRNKHNFIMKNGQKKSILNWIQNLGLIKEWMKKDTNLGGLFAKGSKTTELIKAYRYRDEKERAFQKGCKSGGRVTWRKKVRDELKKPWKEKTMYRVKWINVVKQKEKNNKLKCLKLRIRSQGFLWRWSNGLNRGITNDSDRIDKIKEFSFILNFNLFIFKKLFFFKC